MSIDSLGNGLTKVPLPKMAYFASISGTMSINAEVVKTGNENNLNLIRRFTKRVQSSGVLPRVRSIRYSARKLSSYVVKKKALKSLRRREEIAELIKMGKMSEFTKGRK